MRLKQSNYLVSKKIALTSFFGLSLVLSQNAFTSGGGIVTDDTSSLY